MCKTIDSSCMRSSRQGWVGAAYLARLATLYGESLWLVRLQDSVTHSDGPPGCQHDQARRHGIQVHRHCVWTRQTDGSLGSAYVCVYIFASMRVRTDALEQQKRAQRHTHREQAQRERARVSRRG
mmetsp:Transcript_30262/g.87944  ORF Transcript_30262/g.87944 Transcript_30262/m.87944 type:complete len:125 (-) Transcript_30262:117-491(-)